jgi:hypothetical protein
MRSSKDSCQANRDAFTQVSRSPEVKVRLKDGERATAKKFKEFCKGKIAHYLVALPRVCRRSRVLSYSPTWTLCDKAAFCLVGFNTLRGRGPTEQTPEF